MQSFSGYQLSPQQLTDYINHADGTSLWSPRIELLDPLLSPIADISQYVDTKSVKLDNSPINAVARSCQFDLYELPGISLNTLRQRVQIFADGFDEQGDLLFEVPIGLFGLTYPDQDLADAGNVDHVSCLDLTAEIKQITFLNTYTIPAGTNSVSAIQTILNMDYVPKSLGGSGLAGVGFGVTPAGLDCAGPAIPLSRINITPTASSPVSQPTLPTTITYTRKDNLLDAVNALLAAINYYPLWCDERGVFQSSPRPYYTSSVPQAAFTYNGNGIIRSPIQRKITNQTQLANCVVVDVQNNAAAAFSSIKCNRSQASAVSLQNWSRIVVNYISDDKIPSQADADLRALLELQIAAGAAEEVTFATTINPFHQTGDFLGINYTNPAGTPQIQSGQYPFQETSWTIDFSQGGGVMQHTASRVVLI